MTRYEEAKKIYSRLGVDTDKAIETLKKSLSQSTVGKEMM